MSWEESKKLFRKRKFEEIENDDEIIKYSKDSQESDLQKDSNIHKFEVRKKMPKSWSDADILIKQSRKSILTALQLEKWCESDIFTDEITDEYSEFSIESDEILNNTTALTSQLRTILSGIDWNYLFHTLNNINCGGQLTAKSKKMRYAILYYKGKKYKHIFVKET